MPAIIGRVFACNLLRLALRTFQSRAMPSNELSAMLLVYVWSDALGLQSCCCHVHIGIYMFFVPVVSFTISLGRILGTTRSWRVTQFGLLESNQV